MPTCPGCQQQVSYGRLKSHVKLCKWVWSETPNREGAWGDHLALELADVERRLEGRSVRELERELSALQAALSQVDDS